MALSSLLCKCFLFVLVESRVAIEDKSGIFVVCWSSSPGTMASIFYSRSSTMVEFVRMHEIGTIVDHKTLDFDSKYW